MESASLLQQVHNELQRRTATELDTSTIPVREAIHRMASERLLELAPAQSRSSACR